MFWRLGRVLRSQKTILYVNCWRYVSARANHFLFVGRSEELRWDPMSELSGDSPVGGNHLVAKTFSEIMSPRDPWLLCWFELCKNLHRFLPWSVGNARRKVEIRIRTAGRWDLSNRYRGYRSVRYILLCGSQLTWKGQVDVWTYSLGSPLHLDTKRDSVRHNNEIARIHLNWKRVTHEHQVRSSDL